MPRRICRICVTSILLMAAVQGSVLSAADSPVNSIHQAIRKLNGDRFVTRRDAMQQLVDFGLPAIDPVTRAAQKGTSEVVQRCVEILGQLTYSRHRETSATAKQALTTLAKSPNPTTARRATAVILARQRRIVRRLEAIGARISDVGGTITGVRFDGTEVRDDDLRLLCELPDITYLSLSMTAIGDPGMRHVACLKKLQVLNLYRCRVGDDGVKHLKELDNLVHLAAGETQITDGGLVHFRNMTQLDYLGLRANNVTDAGLVHLEKLTNLTGLYLGETRVTDKGLVHLRGMTKLTYLRLHTMQVSDAAVEHLKFLKDMRQIDLYNTNFTTDGIRALQEALPDCTINRRG